MPRIERDGTVQVGDRAFQVTALRSQSTTVRERLVEARVELQGAVEVSQRQIKVASTSQHDTSDVVSLRASGMDGAEPVLVGDGPAQQFDRRVRILKRSVRIPQVVIGNGPIEKGRPVTRVKPQCARAVGDGGGDRGPGRYRGVGDSGDDAGRIRQGFVVGPFAFLAGDRVARRICSTLSAGRPTVARLDRLRVADAGADPQFFPLAEYQLPRDHRPAAIVQFLGAAVSVP